MKRTTILILFALMTLGHTAWAQQQFSGGTGTEDDPYQINSTDDWVQFCTNVNNGTSTYSGMFFKLMNNITVEETNTSGNPSKMAGISENVNFRGTFDGDGHTMTVNYTSYNGDNYCAPFRIVRNATIKNLHVTGSIYKAHGKHAAGIVGQSFGTSTILNCRSSVDIHVETKGDGSSGGLVGDVRDSSDPDKLYLINCLFDGQLRTERTTGWGGLVGWVTKNAECYLTNCYCNPSMVSEFIRENKESQTIARGSHNVNIPQDQWSQHIFLYNCFYNYDFKCIHRYAWDQGTADYYSTSELCSLLGPGWKIDNNKVVPVMPIVLFGGEGTAESPYLITNANDWGTLGLKISLGENYSGKFFLLTDNISVIHQLGDSKDNSFRGTFDGGGHTITVNYKDDDEGEGVENYYAPFRFINGATIKNLHVTGSIYKYDKKHIGGFVGQAFGTNHIVNCRSSVDIQAYTDGDGSHGGFLGDLRGGTTYFENCLFDGKMRCCWDNQPSPTTKWGGFIGWVADDKDAYLTNCIFAPTMIYIANTSTSNTFARSKNSGDVHLTRCYYLTPLGNTQGKHARSISGNENVNLEVYGTAETGTNGVNGITIYKQNGNTNPCIEYNDVLYSGSGDVVQLNLSQVGDTPEGLLSHSFVATPGTLNLMTDYYNLSVPNADVSITLAPGEWPGYGTADSPWLIQNTEHWNLLCSRVNSGTSNYSGQYFKLMADITVEETNETGDPSKMVGISENVNFRGTFDGNGHTMTVNYSSTTGDNYCAPFRIVRNATIKNLHVTGSIYKAHGKHAAGIVGQSFGTVHITNCRSSVDISSYTDGDGSHGGIVGDVRDCSDADDLYLENCLFDGKLRTTNNTEKWGGLIGWVTDESDDPDAYITNCLFAPQAVDPSIVSNSDSRTFARYDDGSDFHLTNSYYKTLIAGQAQGGIDASSYENSALRAALGDGWEIVMEGGVEKVVPVMSFRELNGEGTEESPYLIATTDDWEALSINVLLGETYSGAFFLMTDDISTDRMVGIATSDANSFQGTFDGDGHTLAFTATTSEQVCAPFRCVKDATIKKLHTTGSITTTNNMAGGIAGRTYGTTLITNCISSMEISKTTSGDGSSGGLVSNVTGGTLTLTDCLFSGSLLGNNVTDNGGLVGWTNPAASVTVTNCLFAPASVTMSTSNSYTLVRCQDNNASFNNSYYTQTFGTVQGIDGIGMDNEPHRMNLGEAWENIGGQVKPIMGIHSFEEGDGTEESPYLIASEDDWNRLASNAYLGETYYAEYFKMTADISVSRMVGTKTTGSNYFRGIFDGDGHTLTFNYTAANDYAAPFRFVANATIKNLHVDGTIVTSAGYAAGIAGETYARTRIENCRSSVVIRSSRTEWGGHGGIVGLKPNQTNAYLTVEGCVFDGKMLSTGATPTPNCGGIVGYTSVANTTIKNCLYAPAALEEGEIEVGGAATFVCGAQFTITNCYYTREIGSNQGKLVHVITLDGDNVTMAFAGNESEYNVSGITTCGTGLKYGDVFYAGNQDAVSLNLTTPYGHLIESVAYTPQVVGGTATAIEPDEVDAYPFTMPDADVTIHVTTVAGYALEVEGYGDSDGGYVLIASPVGKVSPEDVGNMLANEYYDLYRFNQAADLEWENYKQEGDNYHFDLEPGKGYLYANSEDVTLVFPGEAYTGSGEVTLSKTSNTNAGFQGWNLVGNPFVETAYITDGRPFYTMNGDGSEIIAAEDNSIAPMEGVFVIATENDETMAFTTTEPVAGDAKLALNLNQGHYVIDRAIIRFGESRQLPKFQINRNSTKVCIPQDGKDYAVVSVGRDVAHNVSTMPVNFKAKENGTYTISVHPENAEMNYLHLIDNMTGADVDLLATNGGDAKHCVYTFTAKTTDYESRFKLVFSANGEDGPSTGSGTFAFVSNGQIIVNGEGTLQIVDVMGRIVVSRKGDVSGNVSTAGMTPGVYVLRLINGDDVKTQKIVIE